MQFIRRQQRIHIGRCRITLFFEHPSEEYRRGGNPSPLRAPIAIPAGHMDQYLLKLMQSGTFFPDLPLKCDSGKTGRFLLGCKTLMYVITSRNPGFLGVRQGSIGKRGSFPDRRMRDSSRWPVSCLRRSRTRPRRRQSSHCSPAAGKDPYHFSQKCMMSQPIPLSDLCAYE